MLDRNLKVILSNNSLYLTEGLRKSFHGWGYTQWNLGLTLPNSPHLLKLCKYFQIPHPSPGIASIPNKNQSPLAQPFASTLLWIITGGKRGWELPNCIFWIFFARGKRVAKLHFLEISTPIVFNNDPLSQITKIVRSIYPLI